MLPPKTGFLIQVGIPYVRAHIYNYRDHLGSLHIRSFKNLGELKKPSSATAVCNWAENLKQIVILLKTSQPFDMSWNTPVLKTLVKKIFIIGTAAVGSDHINFNYIKKNSISFINTPGCNRFAVRDYVLTVLLKYALFIEKPLKQFHVGIIGCGNVGTEVSRAIIRLGGRLSVFDPYLKKIEIIKKIKKEYSTDNQINSNIRVCSTFNEIVCSKSLTAITLHLPLTQKSKTNKYLTHHLFNRKVFDKLVKFSTFSDAPTPILLINSSRGGIVCEKDIFPYLEYSANQNANHKTGIFLASDVWEQEPTQNLEAVIKSFFSTPHIAGYSLAAKQFAAKDLIEKIISILTLKYNKKNTKSKHDTKTKLALSPALIQRYRKEKLIYENILLKLAERITGLSAFHRAFRGDSYQNQNQNHKKASTTLSERFLALRKKPLRKELREVELILPSKPFYGKTNTMENKILMLKVIKLWKKLFNN